jgi:hypothetical protein
MDRIRTLTRRAKHRALADLLRRLNPVLRGWHQGAGRAAEWITADPPEDHIDGPVGHERGPG